MNKVITTFFFLFSLSSWSSEFDHIAASKMQIASQKCQGNSHFDDHLHFSNLIKETREIDSKKTASIGGLLVEDESVKVTAAYRYLTSHLDYKLRPHQDIDFWNLFKDGRCTELECAANEVFGSKKGSIFLGFLLETGLNLSSIGYSKLVPPIFAGETEPSAATIAEFNGLYKVVPWQGDELRPFFEGIYSLPKSLFPLPPTRLAKSQMDHMNGKHVHSNATIIMYPTIVTLDRDYQKYTMVHEIGHVIGSHFRLDSDPEWVAISWHFDRENNRVIRNSEDGFVSAYAKQDFFEDFAESFAAFRFNPEGLLAASPRKFEFIKDRVFKGQDYLSEKCPQ